MNFLLERPVVQDAIYDMVPYLQVPVNLYLQSSFNRLMGETDCRDASPQEICRIHDGFDPGLSEPALNPSMGKYFGKRMCRLPVGSKRRLAVSGGERSQPREPWVCHDVHHVVGGTHLIKVQYLHVVADSPPDRIF